MTAVIFFCFDDLAVFVLSPGTVFYTVRLGFNDLVTDDLIIAGSINWNGIIRLIRIVSTPVFFSFQIAKARKKFPVAIFISMLVIFEGNKIALQSIFPPRTFSLIIHENSLFVIAWLAAQRINMDHPFALLQTIMINNVDGITLNRYFVAFILRVCD